MLWGVLDFAADDVTMASFDASRVQLTGRDLLFEFNYLPHVHETKGPRLL